MASIQLGFDQRGDVHPVRRLQFERDLEGGFVGVRDACPPCVGVVGVPTGGHPFPADGDGHDREKTTPWPPSGYVQVIAPSLLHTR